MKIPKWKPAKKKAARTSKPKAPRQPSELEEKFARLWGIFGSRIYGQPVTEHRVSPPRKWRLDFAWLNEKVAVEIEGGHWSGGRHTRGSGFAGDCEKYNRCVELGWAVLRYTGDDLKKRPAQVIEQIKQCLANRS